MSQTIFVPYIYDEIGGKLRQNYQKMDDDCLERPLKSRQNKGLNGKW